MTTNQSRLPTWWRTPAGLFFFFCWAPWLLSCFAFDLIVGFAQREPGLFTLNALRYDWGFAILCGCLGFALFYLVRHTHVIAQRCMLLGFQIVFLLLIILEFASFNFRNVTGSRLEYGPMKYAWDDVGGVIHLIQASTPLTLIILAAVLSLGLLATPVLLCRARELNLPRSKRFYALICTCVVALIPPLSQAHRFADVSPTLIHILGSWQEHTAQDVVMLGKASEDAMAVVRKREIERLGAPKNIVFIVLESTRAHSVNPYQSKHEVTPFLKDMASQSIWSKHSYAVVPHTSKALVAILCGFEPYLSMAIHESRPYALHSECLAGLLKRHGYDTAFYQSATQRFEGRTQLIKNMGYETFSPLESLDKKGFEKANYFGVEDAVMLKPSMKWVDQAKKPLFLTYLTLTPHHNYLAPKKRYGFQEFVKDKELNHYLNTVRYVDQFSKEVVDAFKKRGLYEQTIFVFVGDHGEGFAEHDRRQHDNVIYQEGVSIPLIVHDPSRSRQDLIPYNINQLDIIPTVLSLAGWKTKPEQWRGKDLLTLDEERELFIQCWYNNKCGALLNGAQKYIHHFGKQKDERFELNSDPMEKTPAFSTDANIVKKIKAWRQKVNGTYKAHFDALATSRVSEKPPEHIEVALEKRVGKWLSVQGYDLLSPARASYRVGEVIKLRVYYKVLAPAPSGWKVFIHAADARGKMLKNLDKQSLDKTRALHKWKKGQYITELIEFSVPKRSVKGGKVQLKIGLWHKSKGRAKVFTKNKKDKNPWVNILDTKVTR